MFLKILTAQMHIPFRIEWKSNPKIAAHSLFMASKHFKENKTTPFLLQSLTTHLRGMIYYISL